MILMRYGILQQNLASVVWILAVVSRGLDLLVEELHDKLLLSCCSFVFGGIALVQLASNLKQTCKKRFFSPLSPYAVDPHRFD